jgi:hypothetical protein
LLNLTKTIIFNLIGSSMKTKSLKTKKVIAYLQANPSAKPAEVAKKFKMAVQYVYTLRKHTKPLTKSSIKEEVMPKSVCV